ncbi:molybdopterin converting factor subunit 1 [Polynucleobacter asymbioticus]|uniref:Molybdopterin synthase sulfur carrier subunit n=1 Tax=Polynucleobacter asymbioticus TaxID=576611 RepID=A0AAC9IU99_9BURK|nr:molybdopterin converting factor subunit 1 [Polynucleobacter asymbioticus]APB98330.1 molybdopterin synthase sulfur carrier subunit [Polynucleobacter asymbioticus]APC00615.1 molybdopterin synthase sulfur carrier subunit [Polynucleobacter asymbioticus]
MKLELRFFASLREALGVGQENIEIPDSIHTITELKVYLAQRGGAWAEVLADGKSMRCALNHHMVDTSTRLEEGAEVAFFPPVTGG